MVTWQFVDLIKRLTEECVGCRANNAPGTHRADCVVQTSLTHWDFVFVGVMQGLGFLCIFDTFSVCNADFVCISLGGSDFAYTCGNHGALSSSE